MSSRSPPLLLLALLLSYLTLLISAANKDEWRKRSIYQVMVDRFARTDGSTTAPCNVKNRDYCGGTWKGIQNNLDYIQGMGFDAIWISPMSKGIEGMTGDGSDYTGYWVTDMNTPNEHFGTADDLKALSAELHKRGMNTAFLCDLCLAALVFMVLVLCCFVGLYIWVLFSVHFLYFVCTFITLCVRTDSRDVFDAGYCGE
jgi:Alpha amylase, catalytic domain